MAAFFLIFESKRNSDKVNISVNGLQLLTQHNVTFDNLLHVSYSGSLSVVDDDKAWTKSELVVDHSVPNNLKFN